MASSSSFFPSSSSPMTKKTTKFSQIRQTLFQKPSSLKAISLTKRQETVFKKASELSTLCGIEVCVIYYKSDGELETWPKDREKVKDMARRYSQLSDMKRRKGRLDLDQLLEKINKDDSKKNKKKKVKLGSSCKYPDWDPRFDNCSVEELTELIQSLERSQTIMQHRLRAVVESQRQRNMHYMNMANQKQMITTSIPAMNHLQQHSNQVSRDLYNYGVDTSPQLPVSASAFNQAQSLAPIPNSLTIYQNPNMERYSMLLGAQETGTDEFLSANMLDYNSFNTSCDNIFPKQFHQNCCKVDDYSSFPRVQETGINNMNVEDYSGSLWAQETGTDEFLSANLLDYNSFNTSFPKQFHQNSCKLDDYASFPKVQETGINNMDVEDYSGSLWAQGTGINGLQNMEMYGYNSNNNTNGFSHQLVQFPAQRAAPVFQYMEQNIGPQI